VGDLVGLKVGALVGFDVLPLVHIQAIKTSKIALKKFIFVPLSLLRFF
jgi:hypothetical protein